MAAIYPESGSGQGVFRKHGSNADAVVGVAGAHHHEAVCIEPSAARQGWRLSQAATTPQRGLPPRAAMVGFSVLMPDDNDSNTRIEGSIYNRVRKYPQRKYAAPLRGWRAKAWMFGQELSDALELGKKLPGNNQSSLSGVEIQGVRNILLGARVKRICQPASLDRRRLTASGPETSATEPDSSSASLRSASCSHAASTSGSESRLAMSRSSRRTRSDGASFRASASRISRVVLIAISDASALNNL